MPEPNVLKLRLSLMGRPVRNFTFDKGVVSVGRDPEADIFVDNPGVSRDHFRLERTPNGEYQLTDLGSANGTYLNDQMINTAVVRNNDVVRFGKYTLWVGYEQDRRAERDAIPPPATDTERNTVVLSRSELGSLFEHARDRETKPVPAPPVAAAAPAPQVVLPPQPAPIAAVVIAFLLGAALGAGALYLLLTR